MPSLSMRPKNSGIIITRKSTILLSHTMDMELPLLDVPTNRAPATIIARLIISHWNQLER